MLTFRSDGPRFPLFLVLHHNGTRVKNSRVINMTITRQMYSAAAKGNPEIIKGTSQESIEVRDRLKKIKVLLEVDIPNEMARVKHKQITAKDILNGLLHRFNIQSLSSYKEHKSEKETIIDYIQEVYQYS
jgi:hypothetical protein